MLCAEEENRVHELSLDVSRLQDVVQKQREEMRVLEHDVGQKNAELEVVSLVNYYHIYYLKCVDERDVS